MADDNEKKNVLLNTGPVDIAMIAEGKKQFPELYEMTEEERDELRKTDGYQLALKDFWEMAASALGHTANNKDFFILYGKCVYGVVNGKRKMKG